MAERHAVIHEVNGARIAGGPQILRHQRKCLPQNIGPAGVEHAGIDRGEHPLVRVHHQRVRPLGSAQNVFVLGKNRGAAGVGGVNVQPESVLLADFDDFGDRVDTGGEVVPTVATTHIGRLPACKSSSIMPGSASGRMRNSASTGTLRTLFWPMPMAIAPFSIEECDCSEV